jgi:hypothetical protein
MYHIHVNNPVAIIEAKLLKKNRPTQQYIIATTITARCLSFI